MTPRRLHSIRRNKRWRVVTWCGALFIILIWISSEIVYCGMRFGVGRITIGVGSAQSICGAGYANYPLNKFDFDVDFAWNSPIQDELSRLFPKVIEETFLLIPYWMILAAFLATQYFFLPKSLPMTEESDSASD